MLIVFAGHALAVENLKLGQHVLADSVNPLSARRDAWRAAGRDIDEGLGELRARLGL